MSLPHHSENVCIQVDSYGTMLYAVGSRSNVTFLDPREARSSSIWSVSSLDPNCGVRSLAFNQQLLSVGTGAGHLYFYDVRARDWLLDKSNKEPCTLAASDRWMVRTVCLQTTNCDHALSLCSKVTSHYMMKCLHLPMLSSHIVTVH